ncbi:MAG: CapA family protein [Humibacillus sp.]|nr:CapA family protein [Humibacillus sp.]
MLAPSLLALCLTADVALVACAGVSGGVGGGGAPSAATAPSRMAGSGSSEPAPTAPSATASATAATGATSPTATAAPNPASTTPAPAVPAPVGRVTLAFAGDVHFERGARALVTDGAPLTAAVRDTLGRADFAMVNLETALGEGGAPLPGKDYTFRAPVSTLSTLAGAGVDAVSMANNHAADFGDGVFAQTLAARASSPIPVVGIGRTRDEAFTPAVVDVRGLRVAVLASSQISDVTSRQHAAGESTAGIATNLDPGPLRRAVKAAAASHDLVVVMLHWGTQYTSCADERQRETARLLAADGADVVVGGHAHRPQGAGWLGSTFVGYGLGNFVWYNTDGASADTGVLTVSVDAAAARTTGRVPGRAPRNRSVVVADTWTPMVIGTDGVPRSPSAPVERARLQGDWDAATRCSDLAATPG